ncbi:xylose isomerase [Mangrovicoccus sp. HB161399]|uniref:xylose isomerase n=1 Tax=Mangrovicoccus sp. HB161399 TaxID=2720392 RepID=UPI001557FEBC|nr:xylose isomerase [Mangrovicoccus sp. HB161399]
MDGTRVSRFFEGIPQIAYEGPGAEGEFAYRHYNPDEVVLGRRLEDHLRLAVAYWHSLAWTGTDPFGGPTLERPWSGAGMEAARLKAESAFELFRILGTPYFCFHDADVRPETGSLRENIAGLDEIGDLFAQKMEETGVKLLWGTANLFTDPRFMAGAATNPDPEVFAWSAATIRSCMDVTHRLGGENYVMWGGREGYETLLNTDLGREADQAARMLGLVIDYKHKIGFKGTLLIEPKPQEPTKHQYDYDVATVHGFLKRYGFEDEVKLNIEQGHAILAGHSFEHELALAGSLGMLGSIDMNRNDYQSGWDTDQFPNNVPEVALAYYEVLKAGGLGTGGTNFDARVRRQSIDAADLVLGHVGAIDVCAKGLKIAAAMLEDGRLEALRTERYAGWDAPEADGLLAGGLADIGDRAVAADLRPEPRSGRQERLENLVNRYMS